MPSPRRAYSPVSPYQRSFKSFLNRKTKHLHIPLGVLALIILALSVFFTVLLRRNFTVDELNGSWSRLAPVIMWVKSSQGGKILVGALWLAFILTVLPFGAGAWFRGKELGWF